MSEENKLNAPWLIAVWPGMGQVAINAGFYLAAKLEMGVFAEFSPMELFDVDHVLVEHGIIRPARLPRSRLFLWRDPQEKRDLILFIGEAQPPQGKRAFCRGLIEIARNFGVEQIFTFAAMATAMHPQHRSNVFVAATDETTLDDVSLLDVKILKEGHIGGLNGVLLGEVAQAGLHGVCLLGEMPHIFAQLPFPAGSLAVLRIFCEIAKLKLDFSELEQQSAQLGEQLGELLAKVEGDLGESNPMETQAEAEESEVEEPPKVSLRDEQRIEQLFSQASQDRSKAYELKQELDRLGIFADYEDRFLDLFKSANA